MNRRRRPTRVLMFSEQHAPDISAYPDTNEIGIFDSAERASRRFGARFDVGDAVSGYGDGNAEVVPPAEPRR